MKCETGLRPAPDACTAKAMQRRAYTPFTSWSHEQLCDKTPKAAAPIRAQRKRACHNRLNIDLLI
jgi:hypothetical protein